MATVTRTLICGMIVAGFLSAPLNLVGADKPDQKHQQGNVPILEGHKVHKYSIIVSEELQPGQHDLGELQLQGIGSVHVDVDVDAKGDISKLHSRWPTGVKPEILSNTSHEVYRYAGGRGISAAGKSHCELIHAAGSCDGCSTFNWLEVTQLKLR